MSAEGEVNSRATRTGASVSVIGGGLVGSLHAILLAQRGFRVDLYDARPDMRTQEHVSGRSINLTLSLRGREALRAAGLEDRVLEEAIPVNARMIHSVRGGLSSQPYGKRGQCILSVDRRRLNELLLMQAEEKDRIRLHFEHRLTRANLKEKTLTFLSGEGSGDEKTVLTDFIFGCDGAHSTVRRQMMRWGRLDYSQEYIAHGYKELTMPMNSLGDYALAKNYLHIWPRGQFMMIALPNQDHTFTVTLFMPFEIFDKIETEEDLLAFFVKQFPDSLQKIGVEKLVHDYFSNPTGQLISVKCSPHYMAGSTLILGDAAHAVVPFYGQGVNAGFEDCLVFYDLLGKFGNDLQRASSEYSISREKDCHAIADLSMYNYLVMRSHVTSRRYLLRKYLDSALHTLMPTHFIPLNTMVAFTRIPYHAIVKRSRRQRKVVDWSLWLFGLSILGLLGYATFRHFRSRIPITYRVYPCIAQCFITEYKQMYS